MANKLLFKTRIALFFMFLIMAEVILCGSLAVKKGVELTREILGDQAYRAAFTVSQYIDGDKLEEVIKTMNKNHPYYSELQNRLSEARGTLGIKYLYTMTKDGDGRYIYVVDGMDTGSEDFSHLGEAEEFEPYFKNFELALQGQVVKGDFAINSEWGELVSTYIPVRNSDGAVIAFLGADLEALPVLAIMNRSNFSMIVSTAIITILGIIGALILSKRIASPLTRLRDYSRTAAGSAFANFDSSDMDEVGEIAAVIENRMEAVKNILDNTGQGFLTFGKDLLVDPEYSAECTGIFGGSIENRNFLELIYKEDVEKRKLIGEVLVKLLDEPDPDRRAIYFPLLSEELQINGRSINVDYRIIANKSGNNLRFMAILTDITEKRTLESKAEKERDLFKMVVKVAVNYDDFMVCTRDYKSYFRETAPEIIGGSRPLEDKVSDIFRHVHTLKGSFSQLGMDNTAAKLHELESELSELPKEAGGYSADDLLQIIAGFDYVHGMDKDIELLRNILGEDFMDRFAGMEKGLVIDRARLLEVEKKMQALLPPVECKLLLPEMQKLRHRPMRELLKSYPDYVVSLSERLGKQINKPVLTGGSFPVDIELYSSFTKSLTHIFRNAVDHGIEIPEERAAAGKGDWGNISCVIEAFEESIEIRITDDGYGMNIDRIKQKAVEKGMYDRKQIELLTEDEVFGIVFREGFTTKEKVNEMSGRGMGLPSVLKEVEKLYGSIRVATKTGEGTEFCITLPIHKAADLVKLPEI